MQKYYKQKRKSLVKLKASLIATLFVLFASAATAQNVYMHDGETYVNTTGVNFYDSGGASHGPANYWNHWFGRNQTFTHTFRPQTDGQAIQVDFEEFVAYTDNNGTNPAHALQGEFSLRLNDAELYVYEGTAVDETKLITTLTGTIVNPFTIMANGPITFRFKSYSFTEEGWGAKVKAIPAADYKPQAPAISMEVCSDLIVLNATTLGAQIRYTTDGNTPTATTGTVYTEPFEITYPKTVKAITVLNNVASVNAAEKLYTSSDATPTPAELTDDDVDRDVNHIIITPEDVPDRLNETYGIIYTYNVGSAPTQDPVYLGYLNPNNVGRYLDPDGWSGDMPGKVHFEWNQPNTYFKICVVAKSCGKQSAAYTYHFEQMQVPDPTITFDGDIATIEWESGYSIHYTTNGVTPSTSIGDAPIGTGTSWTIPGNLEPGTIVKAIAYKMTNGQIDENYTPSNVVSKLYLPGGDGQSGVFESIVIIDDREDHNWSYYQASTNLPAGYPNSYLSSPDPRNVKITYKGGSVTNGSAVAISALEGEGQNQMLYLKTLEKTVPGMSGNYPYTVISNPFSKRPATGSGNNKTYYGFAGWKIVSGGEYIANHNNNDVLSLDESINFTGFGAYTPNCISAEVVFEATWTEATVKTGNSAQTFTGGTYETNFWVLSGNSDIGNIDVPGNCTMSARYPDGISNFTRNLTGRIQAGGNNAKVEFVNMNSTSRVSAEGYTFTMGRGIVNSGNGGGLYGCRSDKACEHTVKIESGKYSQLRHFSDDISSTNAINQLLILGCDYDRARAANDATYNTKLEITGSMYVAESIQLNRNNNGNTPYIRTYIKSGNFISSVNVSGNDSYNGSGGDQTYYYSIANTDNGGYRYLEVEGGHLRGIAGGMDNTNNQSTSNRSFGLRVRGTAQIDGVVYGAATFAQARGHRTMVFTGGNVDGWIAGGCNGTQTGNGGEMTGTSYVYIGGKTQVGDPNSTITVGEVNGGNVFGAGKGLNSTDEIGEVSNSNVVVADEATVKENVYGGGNYGYISSGGTSNLYILGGTAANVFGGANRRSGETVNITMTDGTVTGNVYGGSNTTGKINGKATIKVSGGTVNNVFGGGYGSPTDMAAGTEVNVSGGTINNNVYGGGFAGTVSSGNTVVNVSGGTMQDVYGAGKGEGSTALISGTTTVNVTGGTVANVYGGGENGNVASSQSGSGHGNVIFTLSRTNTGNWGGGYDNSGWAHGAYLAVKVGNGEEQQLKLESGTSTTISMSVPAETTVTWTWHRGDSWNYWGNQTAGTNCRFSIAYEDGTTILGNQNNPANNTTGSFTTDPAPTTAPELASTVTINGGADVSGDVFGGGKLGTTAGSVVVNMKGGSVHGSVYGGALGEQHSVFVAGQHTVNVMGGRVYANVYGGSRNADDAYSFEPGTFATATNEETVCAVNVSGGQVDQQVYAAGYFGNCYGSVYAFVGQNAIYNAPNHVEEVGSESVGPVQNNGTYVKAYEATKLYIVGSVWAGGDWGTFTDHFGDPTISGKSNVYVDGEGYNTFTTDKSNGTYMCIEGSLFGSGTSCDAGKVEHTVMLRNYGQSEGTFATASRDFASIQRADYLVLDNVHVDFQGQGRINSLNVTEVYAIYEVSKAVIATGGSTLIMDAPTDQIKSFVSASCGNVYTAALPESETNLGGYTAITPGTLGATPNKIRVNGGNYLKIYHDKQINNSSAGYGMLKGYSYMMASSGDNEATCAYARPRWCNNDNSLFPINDPNYDNRADGGFVSYVSGDNVFDEAGNAGSVQMAYENHTPGSKVGEQWFRIWRTTGQIHEREGVFDVFAEGEDEFKYVDVEIELPAWRGHDYYYTFQTTGEAPNLSTTTNYGPDLMTFNAAIYGENENEENQWIYYDTQTKAQILDENTSGQEDIKRNPDVNYGLVILPGTGDALSSPAINGTAAPALIINDDADEFLAKEVESEPVNKFTYTNNEKAPTVTFRLTYSDLLTSNKTYEPMWVNLVQCDATGKVTDIVKVKLVVNTSTAVGRNFVTEVYAVMNGEGSTADNAHVQVVLPRFTLQTSGVDSRFTVTGITWTPALTSDGNGELVTVSGGGFDKTKFAMEFSATENYDGTTGWNELNPTVYDTKVVYDGQQATPSTVPALVGTTGGRSQFSFDFNLTYDGSQNLANMPEPELMGTLVYHMNFTNYEGGDEQNHEKQFTVTIKVYRRGQGTRYYLDGVNGKNSYNALRPNTAMLTLGAIFNRSGFLPGDDIYVVNQVTADNGLEWNGLAKGGQVKLYRYNGGHPTDPAVTEGKIVGNPDNLAYTGALVKVPSGVRMIMRGIDLDGYYMNGGSKAEGTTVTAAAPLVSIEDGGILELNQNVLLEQNYNTADGGAVSIAAGGTLMMNHNAAIKDNKTDGEGAGVYMDGTMIASDQVKVWDNKKGDKQNNVFLAGTDRVLQIGVDHESADYKELAYDEESEENSAKIGLSKPIEYFTAGVAEVVYSAETGWLVEPLNTQAVIVHDGSIYKLETGTDPNKLYWRDTWVTWVTSEPDDFALDNIDSEEDLAWVISIVNGENGCTADALGESTVVIVKDLDMKDHTWVPIGVNDNIVFKGTLEGNGHVVEGIISSLNRPNLGMFGYTSGATIQNLVVKCNFNGVSNNVGTVIGTMDGGLLANVEAAGDITGDAQYTKNIGGLVGEAQAGSVIHSAFAVNTINGQRQETVIGGLVADNGGDLYNSYANVTLASNNAASTLGGLVGTNSGTVQNCYVINPIGPAFAAANSGSIDYCYAPKGTTAYVGTGTQPTTHGTYDAVKGAKEIGYMYADNKAEKVGTGTNDYIKSEIAYANGRISTWPGLLSTLNQWVEANPKDLTDVAPWFRTTSSFVEDEAVDAYINGDLPVLGFVRDNCLATTDGKYLFYGSNVDANGLDNLFETYAEDEAAMFLYGKAAGVAGGTGDNILFINEDAVLLQKPIENNGKADEEYNEINAVVGVTFDNSCGKAWDYYGNPLAYDWHMMSTPLSNAKIGATYGSPQGNGNGVNLQSMTDGYFPNGLTPMNGNVKWDFYSYYEPEYHWINLKRTDHYHIDGGASIDYPNETTFTPGKGYMMAISQDSYLNNTGTLNAGDVDIVLTNQEPDDLEYNKGWNLVGNPYQAYLDLTKLGRDAYAYDAEQKTYIPYAVGASTNPAVLSQYVHPHQAFFVHATPEGTATTETLTFEYAKVATASTTATSYFRGGDKVDYPLVNLFVENETGNRDLAVVELHRPELGGATKMSFMTSANFQIAASMDGQRYGLLFAPEGTDRVPVRFQTEEDGTFTLTWSTYNGDFSSLLLVDNMTGTITDMLRADHYTFEATTDDYASRFYITFAVTDVEEYNEGDNDFAWFDGSEWVVNGKGTLDVVDVLGRTVYSTRLTDEQSRVSLNNVAKGVYLLRVSEGNSAKVQKVVVR